MVKITVDDKQFRKEWARIVKKAIPQAIAATLTGLADDGKKAAIRNQERDFTLRNQYTVRNTIRFPAKSDPKISRINSKVGSKLEYMAQQEEGATIRAKKQFIPVPTMYSRGGDKRKAILARYRMNRIGSVGKGSEFFIGPAGRHHRLGLYKRTKRGIAMLRDLSKRQYALKPRRWLARAVTEAGNYRNATRYYYAAMKALKAGTLV